MRTKPQTFWAGALRDKTPRAGDALDNGALVLLAKPLPHDPAGSLEPCSIVLCLFRDALWTWVYDETRSGCYSGHEFGPNMGQQAAFEDWCTRT